MRLHFYLKEASLFWMIIGTIIVIFGAYTGFELTITYLMATFVFWVLIVGLPIFILMGLRHWLERKSKNTLSGDDEKVACA